MPHRARQNGWYSTRGEREILTLQNHRFFWVSCQGFRVYLMILNDIKHFQHWISRCIAEYCLERDIFDLSEGVSASTPKKHTLKYLTHPIKQSVHANEDIPWFTRLQFARFHTHFVSWKERKMLNYKTIVQIPNPQKLQCWWKSEKVSVDNFPC